MSRSKLIRALLAAASLLGAVPLMAQTRATAVPAPSATFPLGDYTLFDAEHPQGSGQVASFSATTVTMVNTGGATKIRGFSAHAQTVDIFDLQGPCTTPTSYNWRIQGDVLTLTQVSDPCGDPAHAGRTMTLRRTAGTPASPAAAAPAFPYGRYTLQAMDSTHAPPPGFWVEFTSNTIKVMNGDQLVETHGSLINGDKWQIFEFEGGCQEPGDYRWHLDGTTIWMEVINDPCTDRAQSITSVRFLKQ